MLMEQSRLVSHCLPDGYCVVGMSRKFCINYLACLDENTMVIKCLVETIEQRCNVLLLDECFMELPYSLSKEYCRLISVQECA